MIIWNDFVLDDVFGPLLVSEEDAWCRRKRLGNLGVMEDAWESVSQIQETRQEQRPARMVGLSDLDSDRIVPFGMDAIQGPRVAHVWQGEEG